MNNEEKIIELLNGIAQSLEQFKNETNESIRQFRNETNNNFKVMSDRIDKIEAEIRHIETDISHISNRELHMLDLIIENRNRIA